MEKYLEDAKEEVWDKISYAAEHMDSIASEEARTDFNVLCENIREAGKREALKLLASRPA